MENKDSKQTRCPDRVDRGAEAAGQGRDRQGTRRDPSSSVEELEERISPGLRLT